MAESVKGWLWLGRPEVGWGLGYPRVSQQPEVDVPYSAAERAAYSRRVREYTATDPRWHLRSKTFRDRHGHWCDACRRPGRCDAHHVTYDRAFSGTEPDSDLRSLDRSCHEAVHQLARSGMGLREATEMVIRHGGPVNVGARSAGRAVLAWSLVLLLLVAAAVVYLLYVGR